MLENVPTVQLTWQCVCVNSKSGWCASLGLINISNIAGCVKPNLCIKLTLNPAGSCTSLIPLLDSSPGVLVPPIRGKSGGGEEET